MLDPMMFVSFHWTRRERMETVSIKYGGTVKTMVELRVVPVGNERVTQYSKYCPTVMVLFASSGWVDGPRASRELGAGDMAMSTMSASS